MQKEQHVHKLKRIKYKSGNSIFFCVLPDCSFKINNVLVLGKRSLCWRCGESFIMDEYSLRLSKPHCPGCHHSKNDVKENSKNTKVTSAMSLAEELDQIIKNAQHVTDEGEI